MCYKIAVVNFKLPEKFEEAVELVNPMTGVDVDEIESIYKEFHDKATQIFPCLSSLSDEESLDGVWCDPRLINCFTIKAPVIGFAYSKVEEALPVIESLALDMGLSILDWQAGDVCNP